MPHGKTFQRRMAAVSRAMDEGPFGRKGKVKTPKGLVKNKKDFD